MYTVGEIDQHLIGMGHSSSLNKIRSKEEMYERAASMYTLKHKSLDQMRNFPLTSTVHDEQFNYALAYDFGQIVDLSPQDDRKAFDKAYRDDAGRFDLRKAIDNKVISIEGSEGIKFARINWKSRTGKVLNQCNDIDDNGDWVAINGTTNIKQDTIIKMSAGGSVRFSLNATGNGIQNVDMDAVDMTTEDEVADVLTWLYFPSADNLTSITADWGNDLVTNYWASVPQTAQADGTPFRFGWNQLKFPWSSATEHGSVNPAIIDSFGLTFATTGAIPNVRMDNIIFSIGRAFDMKYYSKFLFKDSNTGLWISKPNVGSTDDYVMVDNDTLPAFLMELLIQMAHQLEGTDSVFDLNFAKSQLADIYPILHAQTPNQTKRANSQSTAGARLRRTRGWGRRN